MHKLLTTLYLTFLPAITFAQNVGLEYYNDPHGTLANALAEEFYCGTIKVIQGDVGLFLGLAITAFGFVTMMRKGFGKGVLITMAAGVLLTAMPQIFEEGMDEIGSIVDPLRYKQNLAEGEEQPMGRDVVATKYSEGQECGNRSDDIKEKMMDDSLGLSGSATDLERAAARAALTGVVDSDSLQNALFKMESSSRFGIRGGANDHYLGGYQMGKDALIDAGFKNRDGSYTAYAQSLGVNSDDDFLSNSQAQDIAFDAYTKSNLNTIKRLGLDSYVGQNIPGTDQKITMSGLLASSHLVGVGGTRTLLSGTGSVDTTDKFGTKAIDYLIIGNGRDCNGCGQS